MKKKFYPVVLVAITETSRHSRMVRNAIEYSDFLDEFIWPGTVIEERRTIVSKYLEAMSEFDPEVRDCYSTSPE